MEMDKRTDELKEFIRRIIDVILTLAKCNLPLRGHRENIFDITSKSGNFLNIIDLLSRYDPLLKSHVSDKTKKNKYLSPAIQNEILNISAKHVLNKITCNIAQCPFYSIIVDTTQDIAKIDQLSIIIRYVNFEYGRSVNITESFIGFYEMGNQSATNFEIEILKILRENNIDLKRCRGQGYDGAANMRGKYRGLQARIKEKVPTAHYIHCASHNLNLIMNDAIKNILQNSKFFDTVQAIYVFFSESLPRWQTLNESFKNQTVKKTLKSLCPTRWASRFDSVSALKINFPLLMQCLNNIIILSKKTTEREEAATLIKKMNSFEFVLMLVFQSKILSIINTVSKILQNQQTDLDTAINLLESAKINLKNMRHGFLDILEESKKIASLWKINCIMENKRVRKVKKLFDELALDESINDPLKKFEVEIFYGSLDKLIQQIEDRFEGMKHVHNIFSFLHPKTLMEINEEETIFKSKNLANSYPEDISEDIVQQIINFKTIMLPKLSLLSNIYDLAHFLFVKNSCIISSFPDLCTALQLFLTLPVTSATAERSFSKLKLIKSYLRNTMSQSRLQALSVLSIESEYTENINLDDIATEFLAKKRRVFK